MHSKLDFNLLSALAKTNPEEFERVRAAEIEKAIQNASPHNQKRLRGIQFQVDAKRRIHQESPVGACLEVSKMMQESFERLRQNLNLYLGKNDPIGNVSQNVQSEQATESSAKVLAFRSEA